MIALYLLAAHLLGDFVFQTRWQAEGKLADGSLGGLRMRHVTAYCLPFVPIAIYFPVDAWKSAGFICGVWGLHGLTDSRRFTSTLGDVIGWHLMSQTKKNDEVVARIPPSVVLLDLPSGQLPSVVQRTPVGPLRRPPNPWPTIPIMIDQALHVCQLALLGGMFLT